MNRKYVVGITVLVSLCLLVTSAAATQTTLKEDSTSIATSGTQTTYSIPSPAGGTAPMQGVYIGVFLDYVKRETVYNNYIIYNANIRRNAGYSFEDLPDVVVQPLTFGTDSAYGTGTLEVWKVANTSAISQYVNLVVKFNLNQTWQNSISSDIGVPIKDESGGTTYSSLFDYYQGVGYGDDIMLRGEFSDSPTHAALRDEMGITFSSDGYATGLYCVNGSKHTVSYTREFYNEYEIYADDIGFRGINITRVCPNCQDKLTKSKVWVLDKNGDLLYHSSFHQDVNSSHYFPAEPIAIWLCAASMESDGTDKYVLIYDDTEHAAYCSVKGYTYDAEAGTVLTSVDVTLDGFSDTSDDDGFYFIGPVLAEQNYTLTGSKSGYCGGVYDLYLPYAQDYLIDLPLIPEIPTHTGHGILGIVTTLPYYGICENHTVSIENATWSNTTTTNSIGYYIFDNLEVDNYWINVSKDAYRDNNQSVTVSATDDEIETIDACDATTEWDSDNTLTLNTTDKQEGTGSLQSSGSSTLDFNKSASSAIDASNVTESNGYTTFWYKINDTTRITDYLVFTVGSNGDNTTHKITWSVYKTNFVNDTWKEVWLKFSDGTEAGTLNMSNISWIEVKAAKSDNVTSKIDNIRFYDFSYEIHDVNLDPILSLGVIAKTLGEEVIASFTAILDSTTLNTTSGEELIFTNLSYGMHELTVTSESYFPYQQSVYLDSNTNITAYMTTEQEGGAGVYYPPPHLVEFRLVDIWGVPLSDVTVNATGYETTVVNLSWWQKAFGYSPEVEVYNSTMEGTTDSIGHISFFMVETIKYKMWFTNASQNISAYREIYPKDDRYTITIGEVPTQKIAYWITSEQNDTANTGNITLHYSDYNSPVKTNWVNFSIYYLDNDTLAYTHNFTTINETNENTSINLNASYSYRVKCIADHDDFGVFTWYVTVVFVMPEKPKLPVVQTLKDSLEDWQLQTFSLFVIILFALIFGAYSSGVGGMVVSFMAIGFHLFGMMPLVPTLAGAVIYPLIVVMAILNLLSEQKGSVEV